jgi:hypothetical protein
VRKVVASTQSTRARQIPDESTLILRQTALPACLASTSVKVPPVSAQTIQEEAME